MLKKLKHIADKNFQTNCDKNDAAENIRLVGMPGSEAFSKGKSGHADKECDYGNDQGTQCLLPAVFRSSAGQTSMHWGLAYPHRSNQRHRPGYVFLCRVSLMG